MTMPDERVRRTGCFVQCSGVGGIGLVLLRRT